jgi:hypothetical protein
MHVVVKDGLLAPAVPFEGDPRPAGFGYGALIVLVVTPADAGADVQQSGLGACHSFCLFVAVAYVNGLEQQLPMAVSVDRSAPANIARRGHFRIARLIALASSLDWNGFCSTGTPDHSALIPEEP